MAYHLRRRRKVTDKPRLGYLIDAEYDGDRGCAVLIFLDPHTQTTFRWWDTTQHLSYLLTDIPVEEVDLLLAKHPDYLYSSPIVKRNAILDENVMYTKVYGSNPLAVGGGSASAFRSILQNAGKKVWEAWIRYHHCYLYDRQYEIGMPYYVTSAKIVPAKFKKTEERISNVLKIISKSVEQTWALEHWIRLLEHELPKMNFAAVDIEVEADEANRMPNPIVAIQPIICVSITGSDGRRWALILSRPGVDVGENLPENAMVKFFAQEHDLILYTFNILKEYPFVITFNGDDFDLMYFYNRGIRLNIPKKLNPVYVVKKECKLKHGIHIDLYRFFKNRSIQNYAFKGAYKQFGLDDISKAILGKGKIVNDETVGKLSYSQLATYCLNDADLTYELAAFKNNITFNLIVILSRLANMPIGELCRSNIGQWVRGTFYYIHRFRNLIIPTKGELLSRGQIQTKPKIAGKKYQGAIVRDPKPGIHFNVVVLDFASLYPSETKERNIDYATVNCFHEECKVNLVPDTTHWICTKNRGVTADVIGGLRDARIFIYKPGAETNPFYSVLEQAIKVYINAAYGVFGDDKFVFYCPPVAESVTAYSRRDMMLVIDEATDIGTPPFYGDTDSIFLDNPTTKQTTYLQKWTKDSLNLDLGIDKVYRYGLFSTRKKNYLGVYANGKLDIKGLTGKKSNTPLVIKTPFFAVTDILSKVNTLDDFTDARREVFTLLKKTYDKLKNREFTNMEELAFRMRLSRNLDQYAVNSQHVKAGRMLVDMGFEIRAGDFVDFIKTTTDQGVLPVQLAKPKDVNLKAYLGQLQSVFDQILEPMDMNFEEDIAGKMTLDSYTGHRESIRLSDFMR